MINMGKLKGLLNLGNKMASPSESSKSPKPYKGYDSTGKKRARVYAYNNDLIFVGGAEYDGGGNTHWAPYFKLSQEASAKEKAKQF